MTHANVLLQAVRPVAAVLAKLSTGLLLGLLASCATTQQDVVDGPPASTAPEQLAPLALVLDQALVAAAPPDYPVAAFERD